MGVVEPDPVFCASMLLPLCLSSGNPLHVVGKFLRGDGLHVPSLRLHDEARRPYNPGHKECRSMGRRRDQEVVRVTMFSDEAAREVQATIKDMEDAYVARDLD